MPLSDNSVEVKAMPGRAGVVKRIATRKGRVSVLCTGATLVHPACRRTGLGARLLYRGCSEALSLGLVPVLDVVVSSTAAIALYRREGWTEVGATSFEVPDGQRIEELVFHWAGAGLHRP